MKDLLFLKNLKNWNIYILLLMLLLCIHIFFRFYQIEQRNSFGWDQVDNAWMAKNIIVDHRIPLIGVPIKGDSGFNLGPLYYYLITPFYWVFDLDPIASGVFAGITSLLTFFTLYWVVSRIFSRKVALFAVFLHTVSFAIISLDRVQWNVNFIEPVSLIVFYALYKIISGNPRYFLLLSAAIGFSAHVHFTSVFYPLIIILTLPFMPRGFYTLKYIGVSIPLFFVFLIPTFLTQAQERNDQISNIQNYLQIYYHGFHLRRFFQIAPDAFIMFESLLESVVPPLLKSVKFFFVPLFLFLYLFPKPSRRKLILCYLIGLWFLVPWVVLSLYKGEISNYYFFSTRPFVIIILSYITYRVFLYKLHFPKIAITLFWLYYTFVNVGLFVTDNPYRPLAYHRAVVKKAIQTGEVIPFIQGAPESYFYYIYIHRRK